MRDCGFLSPEYHQRSEASKAYMHYAAALNRVCWGLCFLQDHSSKLGTAHDDLEVCSFLAIVLYYLV